MGHPVPEGLAMTFADRLRGLREAAGLTQAALADAAGLSLGAVRNYEQGIREPYWAAVFKLADALGVSCEAFRDCVDAGPRPDASARRATAGPAPKGGKGKKRTG
jgi:transcriptional regulator with XRE-family HTH domain